MSTKTRVFDAFGRTYRTRQFAAVQALEFMEQKDHNPMELLANTEVQTYDGEWVRLDNKTSINAFVDDAADALPPRAILDGLMIYVKEFNFAFLREWKGAKVPQRFQEGAKHIKSEHVDPLISQLFQDGCASMRELEEYYSLEDAFKMFDVLTVKSVNAALSQEAQTKDAKNKRR